MLSYLPLYNTVKTVSYLCKRHFFSYCLQYLIYRYYRDAKACLLVYDITKRDTFDAVKTVWCKKIKDHAPNASCILVGNKCDKPDNERQVSTEDGQMLAGIRVMIILLVHV